MAKRGSSFPSASGSFSQEATGGSASLISSRKLKVTLLSYEWRSTKAGGLSTIIRELAIQLAKNDNVEATMYLPLCSEEDKRAAAKFRVCLLKAKKKPGYDPIDWLLSIPKDHHMDVVIGHGISLGRRAVVIKESHPDCKWIQVVQTDPEEFGMFTDYPDPTVHIVKKHQAELELCLFADRVVAVGPEWHEGFAHSFHYFGKEQEVINLIPGIFSEFTNINQAAKERETFRVVVFGHGDGEDFLVKGCDIAALAVAMLKDEERSFKLVFVGAPDGEEVKVKERFLKEGILPSQLVVHSSKERDELAKQLCEADLVLMLLRTEGFGLAALEALSAGLPVLVTGHSGIGKALKKVPYGSNCVVNNKDPVKWAEAIKAVCRKEREVRLMEAILLRQSYAETYQWERQCSKLVEEMLEMIKDESVSFKPGALSRDDVLLIANELGSSWKMVGRVLNVPDAVINEIEATESEVFEKCYSTLSYWKERYPSDATYHRLALALEHPTVDRVDVAVKYCRKDVAAADHARSSVPAEIRGRGLEAERAFLKAMESGKVKVYRGRIMLLGQDRAGKTSLKKSLLGLPFDPEEESTVGIKVDRSECELEVEEVENWKPSERKKGEVSEFEEEIAKFMMRDLTESAATYPNVQEVKTTDKLEEGKHDEGLSDADEPVTDREESSVIIEDGQKAHSDENDVSNKLQLNINSTTLPTDLIDLVPHDSFDLLVRYLQGLRLEDDIKAKEVILTLWDFAGQHLYYASHSVFLSGRAVYILVYNLNKNLLATAEPCVRQGINDILLDNPNNETNLDNLLSWLVSVHSIRSDTNKKVGYEGTKQSSPRPPVIIVGTNSDQPFEDVETAENHIKNSILGKDYEEHVVTPFFAVSNKTENDEGVQKLRHTIMEVLKGEHYMEEEVPLRWFYFERVVDALVDKQIYFMDLNKLLSVIRKVCHIKAEKDATAMLNFYHDLGVIVKHGQTVVLQAQWLIDLFKQLITVPPFDETERSHRKYWIDLEVTGILRMALVDHVFSKFIEKGLRKQDILEVMELHGLIAKFLIAADENQDEQIYFVPTQLRSSPAALCEIEPSECDPCPLLLHFLNGFVPHGLFPKLVSEFIHWCSENGSKEPPQLFNNGARLFIGKQIAFDLILICRKRFIKIVLKRRDPPSSKPLSVNAPNKTAIEVRNFIERTLDGFSRDLSWLSNLRYELSVVCTHCRQSVGDPHRLMSCCQDDHLHLLQVCPGKKLICRYNYSVEAVKVPGWEKWFEVPHSQTKESKEDISEDVGTSSEPETTAQGVESRKRKRNENFTGMQDESVVDDDVLLLAHELGSSWKMVGRALNVPDAEIDCIKANETEVKERCYCVLRRWQEIYPSDAKYCRLASALQHPAVGRVDLARKYCGLKYCKDLAVVKDYY